MEALALRLSQLDSHAEGAIRVVMFYDTLTRRRVDLPVLARASAGPAECVTGIRLHGTGEVIRMSPDGTKAPVPAPPASTSAPITLDDEEIGTAWLERPGPPTLLDDMLLDRLAITAAAVVERYGPARTTMADPALLELVIGADTDEAARARALRLLGFPATSPVRVTAVSSPAPLTETAAAICPDRLVKAATVAGTGVILSATVDVSAVPAGIRAGFGTPGHPGRSWREARTALRFTTAREPVVRYDSLGALALLADIPPEAAQGNADVLAVGRLAGTAEDLETLDAYCAAGSLRRAAEILHLHHTSVARRLEQISRCLGFDVTQPAGLIRARVGLTVYLLGEAQQAHGSAA
ncbi:helix-turn-helix domain-containing protein [Longispora albida]|uniref:helix-turn-helix domain-containing protein n=1 Tax=Longispora albida TaxID=203523 RepID=UPI0003761FD6|nr:helix-turn-helix domain-containing protein [Longispora albida]